MKASFLVSLIILLLAGCAFNQLTPSIDYGGWGVPDPVPMPAKGMSPADVQQMYSVPNVAPSLV